MPFSARCYLPDSSACIAQRILWRGTEVAFLLTLAFSVPTVGSSCSSNGLYPPASLPGYWPSDSVNDTVQFLTCEPPSACLGNVNDGFKCADGYFERRCGLCQEGYYRLDGGCAKCQEHSGTRHLSNPFPPARVSRLLELSWLPVMLLARRPFNLYLLASDSLAVSEQPF